MRSGIVFLEKDYADRKRDRLVWLDVLRGLTVVSMVLFHGMWDVVYLYGRDFDWYKGIVGHIWQQSICWSFILIAGISWNLGRHHLRHAVTVFLGGVLISVATYFMGSGMFIMFGILTFLGSAMLFMLLFQYVCRWMPYILGAIVFFVGFVLLKDINQGFFGFEGLHIWPVPDFLYQNYITTFFGFPHNGFASADYFSFLPWFCLFVVGYFIGKPMAIFTNKTETKVYVREKRKKRRFSASTIPSWIGRHALIIYMVHQPILYGFFLLIWH